MAVVTTTQAVVKLGADKVTQISEALLSRDFVTLPIRLKSDFESEVFSPDEIRCLKTRLGGKALFWVKGILVVKPHARTQYLPIVITFEHKNSEFGDAQIEGLER